MDLIGNGLIWSLLAWGVAGALILAGAVAVDARERGQSAALWFLLALLFPGFGALAYLVLRPAEAASLPAALPADRPAGTPERAASAPLGATPARGSVPAATRDVPRGDTPPARDLPAAGATAPRNLGSAAPAEPSLTARPEASGAREPARAPATAEPAHGGTMEWRRGVGVLPTAAPPVVAAPEPPARPEPRRGRGVPAWLMGAAAAVLLLVVVGTVALPRLVGPPGPPPAAPTALPAPTAAPALDAEPAPVAAAEAPPERPSTYTVEEGDTLGGIAVQFDTSVQALMEANGLDDADTVFVGQQLAIPPPSSGQ
jgi:LysM repeat protein